LITTVIDNNDASTPKRLLELRETII